MNIEILCGINIGNFLIRYYGHVAQEHAHNHLLSLLRNKIDSVQYENQIQIAVYVHEMAWGTAWWGRCVVVLYDILAVYLLWCDVIMWESQQAA